MKYFIVPVVMIVLLLFGSFGSDRGFLSSVGRAGLDEREFYVKAYYEGAVFDELDLSETQTHFNGISKSLSKLDFYQGSKEKAEADMASLTPEELLDLLSATVRPLTGQNIPQESIERIRFLLVKSLPDERGIELADTLPGYLCYSREKEALDRRFASQKNNVTSQRQNYRDQIAVREKCMGKAVSDDLFKESDRLTWYMFDRWEIMSDDTLTAGQRKGKLDALMNKFSQASAREFSSEY